MIVVDVGVDRYGEFAFEELGHASSLTRQKNVQTGVRLGGKESWKDAESI